MKFLNCLLCEGELDITGFDGSCTKLIKCKKCGYNTNRKEPEITVIRKKIQNDKVE